MQSLQSLSEKGICLLQPMQSLNFLIFRLFRIFLVIQIIYWIAFPQARFQKDSHKTLLGGYVGAVSDSIRWTRQSTPHENECCSADYDERSNHVVERVILRLLRRNRVVAYLND